MTPALIAALTALASNPAVIGAAGVAVTSVLGFAHAKGVNLPIVSRIINFAMSLNTGGSTPTPAPAPAPAPAPFPIPVFPTPTPAPMPTPVLPVDPMSQLLQSIAAVATPQNMALVKAAISAIIAAETAGK